MRVFADTAFYVAIISKNDCQHHKAVDFCKQYQGRIVTTEYVLVETGNWFGSTRNRNSFVTLNRQISLDNKTLVIPAEKQLYDSGVSLYTKYADKKWSLTDCISFAVMHQLGLTHVLSSDKHFQQAGYSLLLV